MACQHPPKRLYSWFDYAGSLCVCCCECGAILAGGGDLPEPETNTEAAQLDALLIDTPAGPQYVMPGLEPTAQLRMF